MNTPNKILKQRARTVLMGKYLPGIRSVLLISAVSLLVSYILAITGFTPYGTRVQAVCFWLMNLVALLLTSLFSMGLTRFFLHMTLGQPYVLKDLFSCFLFDADRFILAAALRYALVIIVWIPAAVYYLQLPALPSCTADQILLLLALTVPALLLNLPVYLNYGQSYYILLEDENCGILDSMKKSRRLMRGHKKQLFLLYLSFLGYAVLELGTMGFGSLWIRPYREMTQIQFYLYICQREVPVSARQSAATAPAEQ